MTMSKEATMAPLLMPTVEGLEAERAALLENAAHDEATLLNLGERFQLSQDEARVYRRIVEIDYLLGK
jgi:hypothetical protein